jgi:Prophage minor tail protein Z (GPZ)
VATGFTIRADLRHVELALAGIRNGVPRVAARAINRTLTTVRAEAARTIATDIGIPVTAVRKSLALTKANFATLRGVITITGRRIPLIELKASGPEPSRGRGRGVSYAIGGERRRVGSAFIAEMQSGHRGVFKRVGQSARRSAGAWSKNLPIVELRGPSIPHVAGQRRILEALKTLGARTLGKNLQSEIRFLLSRRQVPAGDE